MSVITKVNLNTDYDIQDKRVGGIENLLGELLPNVLVSDFEQGSLQTSTGKNDTASGERHDYRIRSKGFYKVDIGREYKITITADSAMQYAISYYTAPDLTINRTGSLGVYFNSGDTFKLTNATSPYIRIILNLATNKDTTQIEPSDLEGISIEPVNGTINGRLEAVETSNSVLVKQTDELERIVDITLPTVKKADFEQGSLQTSTGKNDTSDGDKHDYRIRSTGFYKLDIGRSYKITITADSPMQYAISYFTAPDLTINRTGSLGSFFDSGASFKLTVSGSPYIRVLLRWASDWDTTEMTTSDLDGISIDLAETVDDRLSILEGSVSPVGSDYVLGADMVKRYLTVNQIGTLSLYQSFCKYGDNYYSTNGSSIAVQDSSFTQTSTTSISVGHGNSFQLGSNGMAYISGWDDQKIYVIDLSTVTLSGTITLPTTGYTTAAIDDVNKIAYIFQRDSRPNTDAQYNFIVYDYDNEQIISTRKINTFQAMQACDFFEDRIIVLWGSSTSAKGYRVYDTSGNTLATYYLNSINSVEPEGVCIDRTTHTLLISDVNKKLFEIK